MKDINLEAEPSCLFKIGKTLAEPNNVELCLLLNLLCLLRSTVGPSSAKIMEFYHFPCKIRAIKIITLANTAILSIPQKNFSLQISCTTEVESYTAFVHYIVEVCRNNNNNNNNMIATRSTKLRFAVILSCLSCA